MLGCLLVKVIYLGQCTYDPFSKPVGGEEHRQWILVDHESILTCNIGAGCDVCVSDENGNATWMSD